MTSKQRAALRAHANRLESLFQVGKGGVTEPLVAQTDDALRARELIKLSVLETSPLTAREAAEELAGRTRSDVVQVIGRKLVLFRRNPENPIYKLG